MPPVRRGCFHCLIWAFALDGLVVIRCAHCGQVNSRTGCEGAADPDLVQRLVQSSQAGHTRVCRRNTRSTSIRRF